MFEKRLRKPENQREKEAVLRERRVAHGRGRGGGGGIYGSDWRRRRDQGRGKGGGIGLSPESRPEMKAEAGGCGGQK